MSFAAADNGVTSRENPSARYVELISLYRQMHFEGSAVASAEETFNGAMLCTHVDSIKEIIEKDQIQTVLDYGCGKGVLYDPRIVVESASGRQIGNLREYWGVDVTCYDPAYTPNSQLPKDKTDLVICTDVIEHCPQEDIDWILNEIFSYAKKSVFLAIACYPASKSLPNGENPHCFVRPALWWRECFKSLEEAYPHLNYYILLESLGPNYENTSKVKLYSSFVGGPPFQYQFLGENQER